MIAAWCQQQLLAPFTIEGACNRAVFEAWLEIGLIPVLKPGQKLVIDNATFHKGGRIEELVKAAGCEIWYLPPSSPDLNKRCDPASAKDARERAPRQLSAVGRGLRVAFVSSCPISTPSERQWNMFFAWCLNLTGDCYISERRSGNYPSGSAVATTRRGFQGAEPSSAHSPLKTRATRCLTNYPFQLRT